MKTIHRNKFVVIHEEGNILSKPFDSIEKAKYFALVGLWGEKNNKIINCNITLSDVVNK